MQDLMTLAVLHARYHGLNPAAVAGIVEQESAWNPQAYRAEPQIGDASYGLMQTLGGTARDMGYRGAPEGLYVPSVSLHYGCRYYRALVDRFGTREAALAAYNAGPGSVERSGWTVASAYVQAVQARIARWDATVGAVADAIAATGEDRVRFGVPGQGGTGLSEWAITQYFGENAAAYKDFGLWGHNGVDFGLVYEPVAAVEGGLVAEVGHDPEGYGDYVKTEGADGSCWLYGHAEAIYVEQGQVVAAGAALLTSGTSGNSSGPHLHLGHRSPGYDRGDGMLGYDDPLPHLYRLASLPQPAPALTEDEMEQIAQLRGQLETLQKDRDSFEDDRNRNYSVKMAFEGELRMLEAKRRIKRGRTDSLIAQALANVVSP